MTYQGFSRNILNDTLFVIKYNKLNGVFIDSTRLVKITNKVILSDSLLKINKLQEDIILYNTQQLSNKNIQIDVYKLFIEQEKKKQLLLDKQNKWSNVRTYSIYILLLTLYLIK